jgi:hypothetical protein
MSGNKTPTKQPDTQLADQQKRERQQIAEIGKHVLRTLGRPGGQHQVQVRPLWRDHYRVNVFVGLDAGSAKVAHSYFLVADSEGNVVESTPRITKQY